MSYWWLRKLRRETDGASSSRRERDGPMSRTAVNKLIQRAGESRRSSVSRNTAHASPFNGLRASESGGTHPHDPSVPRASVHQSHGALYRALRGRIQEPLAMMGHRTVNMRPEEKFVGASLVQYLGGSPRASVADGKDPPDLYLMVDGTRIGVEVSRLSQFTFESDGSLGNRRTQDEFALRLLDQLDGSIGPLLPDDVSVLVGLEVPVRDAATFRKLLTDWLNEVAASSEARFQAAP